MDVDRILLMNQHQPMKSNEVILLEEDIWCVHKYLDGLSIPRTDNKKEIYSIVGRIKQLELKYLHQLSDLETYYLNLNKNE